MSEGLRLAGFDVTGVDLHPQKHYRGGVFVQADALTYPLEGFDFIHSSPPCQSHSSLRHLQAGKVYPCHIDEIRERLQASGALWSIENVPGAPLGSGGQLILLCGTMFGLETPDGRAEIRRHRLFELGGFSIALRPACQHGHESLSVCGRGLDSNKAQWEKRRVLTVAGEHPHDPAERHRKRRAITVTGNTAQTNVVRNKVHETFSIKDARAAMQCPWMTTKGLSQAIPPVYGKFIGEHAIEALRAAAGRR